MSSPIHVSSCTRPHARMVRRSVTGALVALSLTLAACGGDSTSNTADASPETTAMDSTADASDTADTPAVTADGAPAPVPDSSDASDDAPLCATVPTIEEINPFLDEPVTTLTDFPRGAGESVCEATGDGVASVKFSIFTGVTREQIVEQATEIAGAVTDLTDPTLPGAYAYSAAVGVVIDGTEYNVQAITFDVITDPNTPEAIERSAALLKLWLARLGLSAG